MLINKFPYKMDKNHKNSKLINVFWESSGGHIDAALNFWADAGNFHVLSRFYVQFIDYSFLGFS